MAVTDDVYEAESPEQRSLERYRQEKERMKESLMQEFEKHDDKQANIRSLDDIL